MDPFFAKAQDKYQFSGHAVIMGKKKGILNIMSSPFNLIDNPLVKALAGLFCCRRYLTVKLSTGTFVQSVHKL